MKTRIKKQLNRALIVSIALLGSLTIYTHAYAMVDKAEVIRLVNEERKQLGLNELVENETLDQAAALKATDMLGNNYFAHSSPAGITPWHWFEQAGYQYKFAGENLAMDFSSPTSLHKAWMNSPSHRENIVSSKYQEIGIAIIDGVIENKETLVAVQLFGTPLSEESVAILNQRKLEGQDQSLAVVDASITAWKETNQDEFLIYAEMKGTPVKVEALLGDKTFELTQHRENVYLNLFSINELDINNKDIAIRAQGEDLQTITYQMPQEKVEQYLAKKNVDQEKNVRQQVVIASAKDINSTKIRQLMQQNIFLSGGLVLFLIIIGNIWVLEKEEEKLLAACEVPAT